MKPQVKRLIAIGVLLNVAAIVALFWLVLDMRSDRQPTKVPVFRSVDSSFEQDRKLNYLIDAVTREAQDRNLEEFKRQAR